MRVLAADLSLTGTAWCNPDGVTGRVATKPADGTTVDRALIIADSLLGAAEYHSPHVVVVEGLSFHSKGSATADLAKLHAVVELRLRDCRQPFAFVAPSSVKKYATGKGQCKKVVMVTSARERLGYDGHDDNTADAMWLHAAVMDALGRPTVTVPKAHREALPAVRRALSEAGVDCEAALLSRRREGTA